MRGLALGVGWGTAAYAALTILLGLAWWWLLGAYDRRPGLALGYSVWARAQIAKLVSDAQSSLLRPQRFDEFGNLSITNRTHAFQRPVQSLSGICRLSIAELTKGRRSNFGFCSHDSQGRDRVAAPPGAA